ncbi:MAG: hypothetical protein HYY23_05020, partial [Verrucomicrobia bacterium]|nr:hypothetical protein [Verrucomicrobiota bacterium]
MYRRSKSSYWWVKYRTRTGKVIQESTKYRSDVPGDIRKARAFCAEKTLQELTQARGPKKERWEVWVDDFLNLRYESSPKSLSRYRVAWRSLYTFLNTRGILYPTQLAYADCVDYLQWRKKGDKPNGVY